MTYFSRRNQHIVEFSGFEEVSTSMRERLDSVIRKYLGQNDPWESDDWNVEASTFAHEVNKELPGNDPIKLLATGEFHRVFTVVEIFLDLCGSIYYVREGAAKEEMAQVFNLSGSVYTIENNRVAQRVSADLGKKIEDTKEIFDNNQPAYERFFNATGNLFGRKAKPEDIVKDLFIASEEYMKQATGTSSYGNAIKDLHRKNLIRSEQKTILEKLYQFRSDSEGVGHAGSSPKPTEHEARWYLETMISQLVFIDKKLKHGQEVK